jgi:hypothetical protein
VYKKIEAVFFYSKRILDNPRRLFALQFICGAYLLGAQIKKPVVRLGFIGHIKMLPRIVLELQPNGVKQPFRTRCEYLREHRRSPQFQ